MATTEHFYTGNNSTTDYSFTFPYLKTADIKVTLDTVATTAYSLPNSTTVRFNTAPGTGVDIHIYRDTEVDTAKATFAAGSSIRAVDLNNNEDQALYSLQERQNQVVKTTDIKDSAVNSAKILDGTIVNADINASAAIAGSKLVAASTSVPGSMSAADKTKLDGIETAATADQTNAEIRAAVEAASDSNVFTDADHSKLNAIESGATADQTNAEIRAAVEAATDSNVFTDADHTKLNGIETAATADQTASEIKSLIAGSPLDASHLAADSVTTSEIADAELTTLAGMQAGTASKLAGSTALTSDIADLNQIDGLTKQTTISDSDASFPTSGAVVDYVAGQIAPIGGLEVITNDASFPNTQPAAGVVISIADAGGLVVDGSGSSTTARTLGGSTVTINGINSSYNSSTVTAGIGFLVSSTGSGQIYNFHKSVIRDQDILSISTDINDFANRYRVGSSNPTSSLDAGDLFFNTTSGKLLVYNGSTSAWEEAQSVGNFFINTISSYSGTGGNSASFNGSAYRFVLSNAPTNAEQLLVSVNGVVQKPVAGTSQPSEGFSIDGSSIIFSSAPASGSDYFIITIGSTVNIGTPSNNTVTNAILQSGCVDNAKVATDAAIAGSKLADDSIAEVKLDVHNAPSGTDKFLAYTSNGMEWAVPTDTNTQRAFANDANNRVVTGDGSGGLNGEANLTFDGTNLGIDIASPTVGYGGDVGLHIHSSATSGTRGSSIHLTSGTSGTTAADGSRINTSDNDLVIQNMENGRLDLGTNGTHRLTIKGDGKIGINGDSPVNLLTISNSGQQTDSVGNLQIRYTGSESTYNSGLTTKSYSGTGQFMQWSTGGLRIGSRIITNSGIGNLYFTTGNDSVRAQLTGDGLILNGSDTAAANALSDYEEGTYTATLTCLTSGTITVNSSNDQLYYTKIGRVVYVTGRISVSAVSSPNGAQLRLNLPIVSAAGTEESGRVIGWVQVQGAAKDVQDYTSQPTAGGNTYIQIGFSDNTIFTGDICGDINTSTKIAVNFHYVT